MRLLILEGGVATANSFRAIWRKTLDVKLLEQTEDPELDLKHQN